MAEKETLAEYLKKPENAGNVVREIVEELRQRNEWGRHGLFKKIADLTGYTSGYVGKVLTGKQRITEDFLVDITRELQLSVHFPGQVGKAVRPAPSQLSGGVRLPDTHPASIEPEERPRRSRKKDVDYEQLMARVIEFMMEKYPQLPDEDWDQYLERLKKVHDETLETIANMIANLNPRNRKKTD